MEYRETRRLSPVACTDLITKILVPKSSPAELGICVNCNNLESNT